MTVSTATVETAPDTSEAATSDLPTTLPVKTCIAWGLGTVAVAALFNSVNVLLLRYVVDYAGISAALAGGLIAASKLYDAFIDPVVGAASDRTRSSMGRRRPFLLAGGILLAIAALALFNIPAGGGTLSVTFFVIALLVYATGYAMFSVPYMAMPAEMTSSFHERSRLISFRVSAVAVASLLAVFVGPELMSLAGGGRPGHTVLSVFLAVVVLCASLACFIGTRSAAFHFSPAVKASWSEKIRSLAGNRPFIILLLVKLLQLMALAVTQAAMPFLFQRVLKLGDAKMGIYFLVFYGTMILVQPIWVRLAKLRGKRNIYMAGTLLYGAIYLSWYFVGADEPLSMVYLRAVALGGMGGAVLLFGQSLLPDTMEWDYRRTGMRREGMLAAVYTLVEKLAYALGAALTGIVLGQTGYIQNAAGQAQPASAITAIYWLASFIPFAFLVCSIFALSFYDLDEKKFAQAEKDG
ncbi:MFS transporter [Novosphingobium sp. PP1Y]|uniref:MFS transporter n=1 Tax=Novosphingobium sp. PP1Y TaxID=702113 RepID=UPI00020EEA6B|nr:MFS transporter [Novosphingobium sp. PP1Y]CCA91981.1 major facilitator transporter [Novosphingobium sp. PP1Y]